MRDCFCHVKVRHHDDDELKPVCALRELEMTDADRDGTFLFFLIRGPLGKGGQR